MLDKPNFNEPTGFIIDIETEETTQPISYPGQIFFRDIIETLLFTIIIIWCVNAVTGRFRIEGSSMMPTLKEGEYIIINKIYYQFFPPERGDIIVLRFPNDRSRDFIKRIIGVPGDHVEIANQQVAVNGIVLEEPYINAPPNYVDSRDVPPGQFFVLGDNRNNSSDSHSWGFLPETDIIGKAWIIYWSPENWGLVPHYYQPANDLLLHKIQ